MNLFYIPDKKLIPYYDDLGNAYFKNIRGIYCFRLEDQNLPRVAAPAAAGAVGGDCLQNSSSMHSKENSDQKPRSSGPTLAAAGFSPMRMTQTVSPGRHADLDGRE